MINLDNYTKDDIIYPKEVANEYGLSLLEVFEELDAYTEMENNPIICLFEVRCPNCGKYTGEFYYSYWDFPPKQVCPLCGFIIVGYEDVERNIHIVYRKIET